MLRFTALISLMFIVSSVWASCDSCGSECRSACGTRRFRTCCFHYLRRKKGADEEKIHTYNKDKKEIQVNSIPVFLAKFSVPEQWISNALPNENQSYFIEDMAENHVYGY